MVVKVVPNLVTIVEAAVQLLVVGLEVLEPLQGEVVVHSLVVMAKDFPPVCCRCLILNPTMTVVDFLLV